VAANDCKETNRNTGHHFFLALENSNRQAGDTYFFQPIGGPSDELLSVHTSSHFRDNPFFALWQWFHGLVTQCPSARVCPLPAHPHAAAAICLHMELVAGSLGWQRTKKLTSGLFALGEFKICDYRILCQQKICDFLT
jgi:hypothetical protein